jgi:serine/threonine protein kinase
MLCFDANKRYTADEALQHPWITRSDSSESPLKPVEKLKCLSTLKEILKIFKTITFLAANNLINIKPKKRRLVFSPDIKKVREE